jgi:hypothetical protein
MRAFLAAITNLVIATVIVLVIVLGSSLSAHAGEQIIFRSRVVSLSAETKLPDFPRKKNSRDSRYYVVQFKEMILPGDHRNLTSLGAEIVRFLPEDTLVIKAGEREIRTIAASSITIRAVQPYESEWKIANAISQDKDDVADLEVQLFPGEKAASIAAKLRGVKVESFEGSVIRLRTQLSNVAGLAQIQAVEWIQPAAPVEKATTSSIAKIGLRARTVLLNYLRDKREIANPSQALTNLLVGDRRAARDHTGKDKLNEAGWYQFLDGSLIVDEHLGLATAETHSYPVTVSSQGRLKAKLVYLDAAAAPGVATSLVNDLNLLIVDADGREVLTADRDTAGKMIEMPVEMGTYEVRVIGRNVPLGQGSSRQPYALMISAEAR